MYDILVYLLQNCQRNDLARNDERVARKLSAAGFEPSDISEALGWLAAVVRSPQRALLEIPDSGPAFRAYATRELAKLDSRCRGLLLYFEQNAILTPQTRELVLERALAAGGETLTLEQLKLIVLMVLWAEQSVASRLIAQDVLTPRARRLPN